MTPARVAATTPRCLVISVGGALPFISPSGPNAQPDRPN
jgi:hypothetical protein